MSATTSRCPIHVPCLPELADFEEYATPYMGKWHLGGEIFAQRGFDEWVSFSDKYREHYSEGRDRNEHSTYHEFLVEAGFEPDVEAEDGFRSFSRDFAADLPEEYSKPAFLAREATRFVEEHRDRPFVLYVNFLEPHSPYTSPRHDQYDPDEVELPPNVEYDGIDDQPLRERIIGEHARGRFEGEPTDAARRELVSNYWGLASLVDTHAGRILDTLADCGLEAETTTVFTSDHGAMMGSHGQVAKNTAYGEAANVPLVVRLPETDDRSEDNATEGVVERPVSQIDLVPTLLDALGRSKPDYLQGGSWLPFLRGEGDLPSENVFIELNAPIDSWLDDRSGIALDPHAGSEYIPTEPFDHPDEELWAARLGPVRAVISPNGRKLVYHANGDHELYDLDDDPYELENLTGREAHRDVIERLASELGAWQRRTRDPVLLQ